MAVLREATLAGVGVVHLPTVMIWEDIRAGRLVHVLPEWQPRSGNVHAVFPARRGLLPSIHPRSARLSRSRVRRPAPAGQRRSMMRALRTPFGSTTFRCRTRNRSATRLSDRIGVGMKESIPPRLRGAPFVFMRWVPKLRVTQFGRQQ